MHDILIKKGRVIDPVQGLDKELDIGICGDKIAALAADIPPQEGRRVLDVEGRIVTAGIIDLHCHVYPGIFVHGIEPDIAGVSQGVTTVVDGGSAGYATFGGFPKYVSPSCLTTVYCFLHLGATGQSITPELMDWDEINVDAMTETIESNRDIIKGIKLRMVGRLAATAGVKLVATAKKVANHFNLPIMVHIGDDIGTTSPIPQNLTRDFLPLMEAGDILTHVYTGKVGNILRHDSEVLPELREAKKRGVILDVGRGQTNISFEVAIKSMTQGVLPTTISSDVYLPTLHGPVYGLTVTMSEFIALGLSLSQVIEMTTINPANVLKIEDRKGSLQPGMDADISILELLSGHWKGEDFQQNSIEMTTLIEPVMTIKSGRIIPAQPVSRPQPID